MAKTSPEQSEKAAVRLDKWLWAARFYKTRALAQEMIQGGKVHYNGQRCKPSKTVDVGAVVRLAQGFDEKEVTIQVVTEKRQSAPLAQMLYVESEKSLERREQNAIARKNNTFFAPHPVNKPDKKQRRELLKLKLS
ncbi:ribosome-associated heat shock protein Hsp15 [Pseudoalteromonas xiamenensis]|uniref:Heat shock protein 15 n=1 Tax=Pseudoalteromonas xiamenensis TaxID=882626 RepID=A0A975HK30_9GAMM|nr:ribosome-associated heat shock protein Hsp15 [Pseudoalteromonas xiamenensis]QTH70497.1 ribosome-associated heat shock protein Hsp15 [Pseudoalteromonas xiamenensis]WMN58759.1 ribosome-associated heat shock protein Hsp15 [Pseudoalteromonas xiamenensis]